MQIRYVVSTMVFWWRENRLSLEQECEFLRSQGFGVELWPSIKDQHECRYEWHNWPRLAAATDGMLVSMHSRNDSPTLEQWNEQIECAKLLGANIVTDLQGLGVLNGLRGNGEGFTAEVVKMAEDNEVMLCLETGHLSTLKQVGEKFPSLRYCLDTGYANLDSAFSFTQYVDELVPRVAHLHLTDNYGSTDDHEPPGVRGGISRQNWDYLLNALNKHGNNVIGSLEMSPCMPDVMIRQGSGFLFDVMRWPSRPQKQPDYVEVNYNPT